MREANKPVIIMFGILAVILVLLSLGEYSLGPSGAPWSDVAAKIVPVSIILGMLTFIVIVIKS